MDCVIRPGLTFSGNEYGSLRNAAGSGDRDLTSNEAFTSSSSPLAAQYPNSSRISSAVHSAAGAGKKSAGSSVGEMLERTVMGGLYGVGGYILGGAAGIPVGIGLGGVLWLGCSIAGAITSNATTIELAGTLFMKALQYSMIAGCGAGVIGQAPDPEYLSAPRSSARYRVSRLP